MSLLCSISLALLSAYAGLPKRDVLESHPFIPLRKLSPTNTQNDSHIAQPISGYHCNIHSSSYVISHKPSLSIREPTGDLAMDRKKKIKLNN